MDPYSYEVLWIVVLGFIIAFFLAFGIGANDVANSFGTSVGSGVLTLRQACYLATIFEIAGAILLGYKVSDTMRKGILDVTVYEGDEKELMFGMMAALAGSALWLGIATAFKVPVSTTHSIVGSTIGFSLVARGSKGLNWSSLGAIVGSWFVSPIMSGLISVAIYWIINRFILRANRPLKAGLVSLPIIYGLTLFVNVLGIVFDGPKLLYLDGLEMWMSFAIAGGAGIVIAIIVQLFVVPWQKKKILNDPNLSEQIDEKPHPLSIENGFGSTAISTASTTNSTTALKIKPKETIEHVNKLFSFLQVLTAVFGSFAHGGNDVSNAIGPLIAIWLIYTEGSVHQKAESPLLLLLYGGVGIVIGLWLWGRRVIETVGTNLTKITPATGFTIETGSASVVLMASKLGLPISSTHCKVGSVVFVGYAGAKLDTTDSEKREKPVDWRLFGSIVLSWVITIPAAGGMSALLMWILSFFL